nr:hypothetical protein [Mesorhizobium onobrychidis]
MCFWRRVADGRSDLRFRPPGRRTTSASGRLVLAFPFLARCGAFGHCRLGGVGRYRRASVGRQCNGWRLWLQFQVAHDIVRNDPRAVHDLAQQFQWQVGTCWVIVQFGPDDLERRRKFRKPLHDSFQNGAVLCVEWAPFVLRYSVGRRAECRINVSDEVSQQTHSPILTNEDFPDGCFERAHLRLYLSSREPDPRLQMHELGIQCVAGGQPQCGLFFLPHLGCCTW